MLTAASQNTIGKSPDGMNRFRNLFNATVPHDAFKVYGSGPLSTTATNLETYFNELDEEYNNNQKNMSDYFNQQFQTIDYNGNNILIHQHNDHHNNNKNNNNNNNNNKINEYFQPIHHKPNKNNIFVYPAKCDDPTDIHIDRNVLIEPLPVEQIQNQQMKMTSPPRTPSPNTSSTSDGDSGYSSKQMSPVSMSNFHQVEVSPRIISENCKITPYQERTLMSPTYVGSDFHKGMAPDFQRDNINSTLQHNLLLEKYQMLAMRKNQLEYQKLKEKHFQEKQLFLNNSMNQKWPLYNKDPKNSKKGDIGNELNNNNNQDIKQNLNHINNNTTNNNISELLSERFKKLTTDDTMQLRTLRVQESIRQTLAACNVFNKENLEDVSKNPELLNQISLQDLNNVDTLADPRWSGLKQYGYGDYKNDFSRKDHNVQEPSFTWSGHLPAKIYKSPIYSNKVFLGGVPWDITEAGLMQAFRPFGALTIEWPGKDGKHSRHPPKGYVYLLFESEKSVKNLLSNCTHDFTNGGDWYYKISSRRMRFKEVQVIPWVLSDSNFVRTPSQRLDSNRTIFVGGLHGMINAEALCQIMNDLFDGVIYAGIDTDKHKYPIGSGRVTFSNNRSFMKAVQASFIEIRSPKFTKKVQIDPYLEDAMCSQCNINPGPFFCRSVECFKYFCSSCWSWYHSIDNLKFHRPLTRHSKTGETTSSAVMQ